ncbi:Uncharacterised protein [Nocardia farcinica]|uniref:Uncharacterized protein n=1 Tax=Nocardia farcinica TaxID=37329 RepID=A0A449GNR8_NOCFR|nr:hypothetical protein [Nocardia farcinica]VFA94220.1 Uncharacterised protein [Nocardia farcinica]
MASTTLPDLSGDNVDRMLDDGATGLQYFAQLHGRYTEAFGHEPSHSLDRIYALYDEQRGMDLDKLAATAGALATTLGEVDEQWDTQKALSERLPTLWQGQAAEAAQYMFGQQVTMADDDRAKARAALDAMTTAIPALRTAVRAKADHVKKLVNGQVEVGSLTVDDLDMLIACAAGGLGRALTHDLSDLLSKAAGNVLNYYVGGLGLSYLGGRVVASRILERVFKPHFDARLQNYVDMCKLTDDAVKSAYAALVTAVEELDRNPYPQPAAQNSTPSTPGDNTTNPGANTTNPGSNTTNPGTNTTNPGTDPTNPGSNTTNPGTNTTDPGNDTSTPGTPGSDDPGQTNPAGTANPLSGLAGLSQLAQQLSPLATTLAQEIQTGLTSLSGQVSDGIDKAVEQWQSALQHDTAAEDDGPGTDADDPDGDAKEKGVSAEFDLGDKHMEFTVGPDGQPKLVATGPDGSVQEYTLELDENGRPVIVESGTGNDDSDGEQPPASDRPSGDESNPQQPAGRQPAEAMSPGEQPDAGQPPAAQPTPPADDPSGEEGSPAGNSQPAPGVPGVPSGARREEDGEYQPQPLPVDAPAADIDQPADSGAQLAEAGPL